MRPAQLSLDLQALYQNAQQALEKTNGKVIAVVKNDGYHFGLKQSVGAFYAAGVRFFATTSLKEAQIIRQAYDDVQILLINPCQNFEALRQGNIQGNIPSLEFLATFKDQMDGIEWHLEWAGLMRRSGSQTLDEAQEIINMSQETKINLVGLWTHFAWADEIEGAYEEEKKTWLQVRKILSQQHDFTYIHSQNSASFIREGGLLEDEDWARLGIYLYGCLPYPNAPDNLCHAVTLQASVINLIDLEEGQTMGYSGALRAQGAIKVAVINIGYGDGLLRSRVKVRGEEKGKQVKIKGQLYELGNLMMSHCLALVDEQVRLGDQVVFYDEELPIHYFTQQGVGANSEQISALNHDSLNVVYLPLK